MIAASASEVCVARRCELLNAPRAPYYRGLPSGLRQGDDALMRRIDEIYMEHPWMGSRSIAGELTTPDSPCKLPQVSASNW
jgi:putative transposase